MEGGGKREREYGEGEEDKRARVDDDAVVLKLLAPNAECGKLIGKGGTVIKQTMEDSGARVRISGNEEVIPGTGERIITIMGGFSNVIRGCMLVSGQLNEARPGEERAEEALRFLVPNFSAGLHFLFTLMPLPTALYFGGLLVKDSP